MNLCLPLKMNRFMAQMILLSKGRWQFNFTICFKKACVFTVLILFFMIFLLCFSMKETLNHRLIRSKRNETGLAKEIMHIERPEEIRQNSFCTIPSFVIGAACPKAIAMPKG